MRLVLLALLAVLAFVTQSCTAIREQRKAVDPNSARSAQAASALKGDRETVARFSAQPVALKQASLIEELDLYKKELAAQGKYDCCVDPGCNECVINSGECKCRKAVEKSGPCCGECTAAWIAGRGDIPGIDREKVLQSLGCVRELYEKKMPDENAAPVSAPGTHEH